ncbi:MAG TPA: hypothetical protein PL033_18740 [Candidatus Brocadiia bacterium]|nr:hypothetical protein [Candidatus Brocadiia bacterium]
MAKRKLGKTAETGARFQIESLEDRILLGVVLGEDPLTGEVHTSVAWKTYGGTVVGAYLYNMTTMSADPTGIPLGTVVDMVDRTQGSDPVFWDLDYDTCVSSFVDQRVTRELSDQLENFQDDAWNTNPERGYTAETGIYNVIVQRTIGSGYITIEIWNEDFSKMEANGGASVLDTYIQFADVDGGIWGTSWMTYQGDARRQNPVVIEVEDIQVRVQPNTVRIYNTLGNDMSDIALMIRTYPEGEAYDENLGGYRFNPWREAEGWWGGSPDPWIYVDDTPVSAPNGSGGAMIGPVAGGNNEVKHNGNYSTAVLEQDALVVEADFGMVAVSGPIIGQIHLDDATVGGIICGYAPGPLLGENTSNLDMFYVNTEYGYVGNFPLTFPFRSGHIEMDGALGNVIAWMPGTTSVGGMIMLDDTPSSVATDPTAVAEFPLGISKAELNLDMLSSVLPGIRDIPDDILFINEYGNSGRIRIYTDGFGGLSYGFEPSPWNGAMSEDVSQYISSPNGLPVYVYGGMGDYNSDGDVEDPADIWNVSLQEGEKLTLTFPITFGWSGTMEILDPNGESLYYAYLPQVLPSQLVTGYSEPVEINVTAGHAGVHRIVLMCTTTASPPIFQTIPYLFEVEQTMTRTGLGQLMTSSSGMIAATDPLMINLNSSAHEYGLDYEMMGFIQSELPYAPLHQYAVGFLSTGTFYGMGIRGSDVMDVTAENMVNVLVESHQGGDIFRVSALGGAGASGFSLPGIDIPDIPQLAGLGGILSIPTVRDISLVAPYGNIHGYYVNGDVMSYTGGGGTNRVMAGKDIGEVRVGGSALNLQIECGWGSGLRETWESGHQIDVVDVNGVYGLPTYARGYIDVHGGRMRFMALPGALEHRTMGPGHYVDVIDPIIIMPGNQNTFTDPSGGKVTFAASGAYYSETDEFDPYAGTLTFHQVVLVTPFPIFSNYQRSGGVAIAAVDVFNSNCTISYSGGASRLGIGNIINHAESSGAETARGSIIVTAPQKSADVFRVISEVPMNNLYIQGDLLSGLFDKSTFADPAVKSIVVGGNIGTTRTNYPVLGMIDPMAASYIEPLGISHGEAADAWTGDGSLGFGVFGIYINGLMLHGNVPIVTAGSSIKDLVTSAGVRIETVITNYDGKRTQEFEGIEGVIAIDGGTNFIYIGDGIAFSGYGHHPISGLFSQSAEIRFVMSKEKDCAIYGPIITPVGVEGIYLTNGGWVGTRDPETRDNPLEINPPHIGSSRSPFMWIRPEDRYSGTFAQIGKFGTVSIVGENAGIFDSLWWNTGLYQVVLAGTHMSLIEDARFRIWNKQPFTTVHPLDGTINSIRVYTQDGNQADFGIRDTLISADKLIREVASVGPNGWIDGEVPTEYKYLQGQYYSMSIESPLDIWTIRADASVVNARFGGNNMINQILIGGHVTGSSFEAGSSTLWYVGDYMEDSVMAGAGQIGTIYVKNELRDSRIEMLTPDNSSINAVIADQFINIDIESNGPIKSLITTGGKMEGQILMEPHLFREGDSWYPRIGSINCAGDFELWVNSTADIGSVNVRGTYRGAIHTDGKINTFVATASRDTRIVREAIGSDGFDNFSDQGYIPLPGTNAGTYYLTTALVDNVVEVVMYSDPALTTEVGRTTSRSGLETVSIPGWGTVDLSYRQNTPTGKPVEVQIRERAIITAGSGAGLIAVIQDMAQTDIGVGFLLGPNRWFDNGGGDDALPLLDTETRLNMVYIGEDMQDSTIQAGVYKRPGVAFNSQTLQFFSKADGYTPGRDLAFGKVSIGTVLIGGRLRNDAGYPVNTFGIVAADKLGSVYVGGKSILRTNDYVDTASGYWFDWARWDLTS